VSVVATVVVVVVLATVRVLFEEVVVVLVVVVEDEEEALISVALASVPVGLLGLSKKEEKRNRGKLEQRKNEKR
jgi:hypothetical protein